MTELTEYFNPRELQLLRLCVSVMHTNKVTGMTIREAEDPDIDLVKAIQNAEEYSLLLDKLDALKLLKEDEKMT